MPGIRERRAIDRSLSGFFTEYTLHDFCRGIRLLSRFYGLRTPRVEWFEYLDWGKTAGRTYENGKIHLVHPENWKKGRKYKSARQWILTVYHEMGHYVFWADAERKADAFAYRFVRGVANGNGNGQRPASRAGHKVLLRRSRPRRRPRRSRSR